MPHFEDKELVQRAKEGDKEAYEAIFNRYSGKILNYLYRYIGDFHKAEEITIDAFLDVYKRLPFYKEEGRFSSWLYKIATNFAKKEFRKRKKSKEISIETPIGEDKTACIGDLLSDNKMRPDSGIMEKEFQEILEEVVANLDEKYRSVLLLCDMQEMSYEEAAHISGCSRITIGVRLNRARKLLHEALHKKGYNI